MDDHSYGSPTSYSKTSAIRRGTVLGRCPDGSLRVTFSPSDTPISCDALRVSGASTAAEGDDVLVWVDEGDSPVRGVVLGIIDRAPISGDAGDDLPDALVLEAKDSLT